SGRGRSSRPYILRTKPPGLVPARRRFCRQDTAWGKASRYSGRTAEKIRSRHQSDNRQGARPRSPADAARPRRRGDRVKRREFITLLGGATAAWPLAARAQQPTPIVGLINSRSAQDAVRNIAAFRKGLDETGYVEGQDVMVEYHWLKGQPTRVPVRMAGLVGRGVDVIATPDFRLGAQAAKAATSTIPIVFGVGDDPVKLGLVASLARPGGNATGVNSFNTEVVAKRLG